MKQLLIVRHAKSSREEPDLDDHDRPLNKRGQRDAPRMGRLLRDEGLVPECIISSTALRARTTAERMARSCGYDKKLRLTRWLYLADTGECLRLLRETSPEYGSLMLVGHNPGLEELVEHLSGRAASMPTAAVAQISLPIERWADLDDKVRGELLHVWSPKKLSD